jgi:26S proteasome non-ATPase regulatory subunit 5
MLEGDDVGQQVHALETVAHICRSPERKLELERNSFFDVVIPPMTRHIKSGTAEAKVRALAVLADLIELHPGETEQEEAKVNEDFLAAVDPKLLSSLMDMAKQPFPDMASTVHVVFLRMAHQKWGLEKFKAEAGFFEMLLDRSVSSEKQVTDLKYEVVEKCVETDSAVGVVPADILLRLKQYVKEGPYFGVSGLRVALDQE